MYKKIILIIAVCFCSRALQAQADSVALKADTIPPKKSFVKRLVSKTFNNYFNDTADPEKPKFLIYPTIAYSPETSWEIGASALYLFYANRDTLNRLSEVQSFTFYTLQQQYGVWLDHFIYTNKEKWFFLGRMRLQRFPLSYFGIGPNSLKEDKITVNSDYILIRERVLRKIAPNLFTGIEIDFQKIYNINLDKGNSPLPDPKGSDGTQNFGLGTGLVYDDRHNALNVRKGHFGEIAFMNYSPDLGSDYKFNSLNVDGRLYRTVKKNQVFAAQVFGQFVSGDIPFNQLALLGSEGLMRGYYYGRYRDKNYIAAQAEYRFLPFPFSKRIGAAAFVSAGSVAPAIRDFSAKNILPSAGIGLRYLVFPKKDIFLRFDVGFTKEGPAFYIYTGEAF
ncbi:MAG: BamA/TamA family outer membrane protein [Rhizobacter sp.]|nr:BamA/TamA family outer membrane protein [Ferruginibacter sp.]